MSKLPPLPDVPVGRYHHYKGLPGHLYELIGVVRHSETLEPLALYRPLDGGSTLWVRPWAMFFETVLIDGVERARFARVAGVARLVEPPETPAQPPAISS